MVHKMPIGQFVASAPNFDFQQYFADLRAPAFTTINVRVPDFFTTLNTTLAETGLETIQTYLTWHYISAYAPELSKPFVNENFDFYQRYLTGAKELQPRWKRCVELTDSELGEALGQKYVKSAFGKDARRLS